MDKKQISAKKKIKATDLPCDIDNTKTYGVKINLLWYFVFDYMDMILNTCAGEDKDFMKYFLQLRDYVYQKMQHPEGEIINEYAIFEMQLFKDSNIDDYEIYKTKIIQHKNK